MTPTAVGALFWEILLQANRVPLSTVGRIGESVRLRIQTKDLKPFVGQKAEMIKSAEIRVL